MGCESEAIATASNLGRGTLVVEEVAVGKTFSRK